MPTPPGYADISCEMRHVLLSRTAWITFGADPTSTDPSTVGALVAGCIAAAGSLNSRMDTNVTWTRIRVSLGTDGTEDLVGEHPMALAGTRSAITTPPNISVLVHKQTSRGGRRGRGRMFIPWWVGTSDVNEAGVITTGEVTTMQNAVNTFLSGLSAGNVPMYVLHRESEPWNPITGEGVEHPTTPGPPSAVTGLRIDPLISTQRRRLGR